MVESLRLCCYVGLVVYALTGIVLLRLHVVLFGSYRVQMPRQWGLYQATEHHEVCSDLFNPAASGGDLVVYFVPMHRVACRFVIDVIEEKGIPLDDCLG